MNIDFQYEVIYNLIRLTIDLLRYFFDICLGRDI